MGLNYNVWLPHLKFTLQTIAITYPARPNEVSRKKYYDFIQNLPLFLPISNMGNLFSTFLDKYPVTPYLDSRESFIKWMHFIHNKINIYLDKNPLNMTDAMKNYYNLYKPKAIKNKEDSRMREKMVFFSILCLLIIIIVLILK